MSRNKKDVLRALIQKEYQVKCYYRTNVKIVKDLVLQKDAKFKRVHSRQSVTPICYEGGNLYCDSYRTCLRLEYKHLWCIFVLLCAHHPHSCGIKNIPQACYKLPQHVKQHKIEDALTAEVPLEHLPMENEGWRSSFFALTKDSWLIRYGMMTGKELEAIYLSHQHSYRTMAWNIDGYSFAIKSTHRVPARNLSPASNSDIIQAVGVFDVFPLKSQGILEVRKSIFGHDTTDAMVSLNALVVCHSNEVVRIYSWEHILQEGQQFELKIGAQHDGNVIGSPPYGLPPNVELEEAPPILFQVKTSNHSLVIGGIPFHYVTNPPKTEGRFQVYSLASQEMAVNGDLQLTSVSIEQDRCYFHADDSGRIIHIGAEEMIMSRIVETNSNGTPESNDHQTYKIVKEFAVLSTNLKQKTLPSRNQVDGLTVTMSGRIVKRKQSDIDESFEGGYGCIQHVDYENEMDMIVLTAAYDVEAELNGFVYMVDNDTGTILKEIKLDEPWKEFHDHTIIVDLDTIIHITKAPMRKFNCYIHKLDRSLADEDDYPPFWIRRADHIIKNPKCTRTPTPNFRRVAIRRGQRNQNTDED